MPLKVLFPYFLLLLHFLIVSYLLKDFPSPIFLCLWFSYSLLVIFFCSSSGYIRICYTHLHKNGPQVGPPLLERYRYCMLPQTPADSELEWWTEVEFVLLPLPHLHGSHGSGSVTKAYSVKTNIARSESYSDSIILVKF